MITKSESACRGTAHLLGLGGAQDQQNQSTEENDKTAQGKSEFMQTLQKLYTTCITQGKILAIFSLQNLVVCGIYLYQWFLQNKKAKPHMAFDWLFRVSLWNIHGNEAFERGFQYERKHNRGRKQLWSFLKAFFKLLPLFSILRGIREDSL